MTWFSARVYRATASRCPRRTSASRARLAARLDRGAHVREVGVQRRRAAQRLLRGVVVLGLERVGDRVDHRAEALDGRFQRAGGELQRVDREEHEVEHERRARADQRVDEAREARRIPGNREDGDQHARVRGLDDDHLVAAEEHDGHHPEEDDHRDLPRPGADELDDEVGDEHPERDADGELDRPLGALTERDARGR